MQQLLERHGEQMAPTGGAWAWPRALGALSIRLTSSSEHQVDLELQVDRKHLVDLEQADLVVLMVQDSEE